VSPALLGQESLEKITATDKILRGVV